MLYNLSNNLVNLEILTNKTIDIISGTRRTGSMIITHFSLRAKSVVFFFGNQPKINIKKSMDFMSPKTTSLNKTQTLCHLLMFLVFMYVAYISVFFM